MALKDLKITSYKDNISELPDTPSSSGITATELKALFDGRTNKEVKEAINGIIEFLEGGGAGGEIKIEPTKEGAPDTLQGALNSLEQDKVDKIEGKGLSTNDLTDELKESYDNASTLAHSHENKSVLDLFTEELKKAYDTVASVFSGLTVATTLGSDNSTVPTSKAVADAISFAGGGDMLKAIYDSNNNGVVDNAERLNGYEYSYFAVATETAAALANKLEADDIANKADKAVNLFATIPSSAWVEGQNVVTLAVVPTDTPFVDLNFTSESVDEVKAIEESWSNVYKAVANDGSITFYATEEISVDIPIIVKVVG